MAGRQLRNQEQTRSESERRRSSPVPLAAGLLWHIPESDSFKIPLPSNKYKRVNGNGVLEARICRGLLSVAPCLSVFGELRANDKTRSLVFRVILFEDIIEAQRE
jgi:hypothetical protein